MNDKERINKALDIAVRYGQIDGSHHRTWVIDQMIRVLSENYPKFVAEYETDEDGNEYEWDCGIAP